MRRELPEKRWPGRASKKLQDISAVLFLLLLLLLHLTENGKESFLLCVAAFLSPLKDGFSINPIRNFFLVRKTGYYFRILGNKAVLEK